MRIGKGRYCYQKKWIKESKKGLETIARYRLGSETKAEKYWQIV